MFRAHVLETCRGMKWNLSWNKILCIKLVKYWVQYTEMHGQQNIETFRFAYKWTYTSHKLTFLNL